MVTKKGRKPRWLLYLTSKMLLHGTHNTESCCHLGNFVMKNPQIDSKWFMLWLESWSENWID